MIYPYLCQSCNSKFDVTKSVKDIDTTEHCPKCSAIASRQIAGGQSLQGLSDWNSAHFNHALGQWVSSNKEASRIARSKGMIEVGTEDVEKIHKKYDNEREEKIRTRYDEIRL